jgi:hypothetical protein
LTISKLKRWSINYYIDTATTSERAGRDLQRANSGLGEYYSEHETRTPVWLVGRSWKRWRWSVLQSWPTTTTARST